MLSEAAASMPSADDTALWAAGFQAGQQMANLAVLGAPGAPGAVAPIEAAVSLVPPRTR